MKGMIGMVDSDIFAIKLELQELNRNLTRLTNFLQERATKEDVRRTDEKFEQSDRRFARNLMLFCLWVIFCVFASSFLTAWLQVKP